jgi:MFS family permease
MNRSPLLLQWPNRWYGFGAISLVFFFLNLATFTSLGVVLYTMVAELHWSMTAAGFSFSLLGIACGVSSPFAAVVMRWTGGRIAICLGTLLLLIGFFLASLSSGLALFYTAMVFLGVGYSLAGNVPSVYLIGGWFQKSSASMIGVYLMLGALGAAFGPPIVDWIVRGSGGWRGHWEMMAVAAGVIGVICLAFIREPATSAVGTAEAPQAEPEWSPRRAVFTRQFLLVAASMAATMACVTTNSSVTVTHLVKLGATPTGAALVLSAIAITATLVKGISGRLCEKVAPPLLLAAGLVLQAIGCVILGVANTTVLQYASAVVFGTGWGLAYVAATVVLLDYFGLVTGSKILSIVWLLTTVAAAGPMAAGMIADRYGTFAPIFDLYAVMLLVIAVPIFTMRDPAGQARLSPAAG